MPQPNNSFATRLLAWWDQHGRHDLPWQQQPTPYRVWVSEIMLQQTQVATVERYFDRFMRSFPALSDLAAATPDDVLHHWSGLGYYSRARNLHRAAQQVMQEHQGELPQSPEALLSLPGIGRSTAGAILSLAMHTREPILDGNVKRVLARVYAVEGWTGSTVNLKRLWALSEAVTPQKRVANYTQAIMDLGATLCTRAKPQCEVCPMARSCLALKQDIVSVIPTPKPKKAKPRKSIVMLMATNPEGEVLLVKRASAGIWGGLWSFPELQEEADVPAWCLEQFGGSAEPHSWAPVAHSFSHYDLDMTPVSVRIETLASRVMDGEGWLWYNTRSPAEVGLAAPVSRLLKQLHARTGEDT